VCQLRGSAWLPAPFSRLGWMREKLLEWYSCNGRDLPWRETSDPYSILVSEVMLQQTWVASVNLSR
jgi:A/G-specific adenine glycosylase